jgi:hypothetical protein
MDEIPLMNTEGRFRSSVGRHKRSVAGKPEKPHPPANHPHTHSTSEIPMKQARVQ